MSGPTTGVEARVWKSDGDLASASTPDEVHDHGWLATSRIATAVGPVALISLHAKTQGSAVAHIEALIERLQEWLAGSFILAGDFNSCRAAEQRWPGFRHLEFFETAESRYRMVEAYWREHGREERTFWKDCHDAGQPFQDDHIFVSADLKERIRGCSVLDYEQFRGISDHTPMLLEIDL